MSHANDPTQDPRLEWQSFGDSTYQIYSSVSPGGPWNPDGPPIPGIDGVMNEDIVVENGAPRFFCLHVTPRQ